MLGLEGWLAVGAGVIYFSAIVIGAVRFSGKPEDAEYDLVDHAVMLLLSPFFIAHRIYVWFRANWFWFLTDFLPRALRWVGRKFMSFLRMLWNVFDFIFLAPIRFVIRKIDELYAWIFGKLLDLTFWIFDQLRALFTQHLARFIRWTWRHLSRLCDRVVQWIEPAAEFLLRQAIRLKNFLQYCLERLQAALDWMTRQMVRWLEVVIQTIMEYLRYIWRGIYDNIIYPIYFHVFYRFCYVIVYQSMVAMFWSLYEGFIQGMQSLYNKLYETYTRLSEEFLAFCARFSGNFWQKYDQFWQHMSHLYTRSWERYEQLYQRMWNTWAKAKQE
jgi:hypothetical protein